MGSCCLLREVVSNSGLIIFRTGKAPVGSPGEEGGIIIVVEKEDEEEVLVGEGLGR